MKTLLLPLAGVLALCCAASAESTVGVAYGRDTALTHFSTAAGYSYWVAGTPSGVLLKSFIFVDTGLGPNSAMGFTASKIDSFKCYHDPFFGKVADVWMEGLFNYTSSLRNVVAHFRVSDSDFAGPTVAYMAMDIYLPGHLDAPLYSSVGITSNNSHILCIGDPGPLADGAPSGEGLAYTGRAGVIGITNRGEKAESGYNVAFNNLYRFVYADPHIVFSATNVRAFSCTNDGMFGKQANFWVEGVAGDTLKSLGNRRLAHVIVTDSASPVGINIMFIDFFMPGHTDTPIYERVVFVLKGEVNILCK